MVFSQLARTTPHCTFVTDAPYMENEQLPGRTVVTVEDEEAFVTFYLVVRTDASGSPRSSSNGHRPVGISRSFGVGSFHSVWDALEFQAGREMHRPRHGCAA